MKTALSFALFTLALFAGQMIAHDVIGIIINDTQYYMELSTSDVKHGSVVNIPAVRLSPFGYTNFTLSSPFIGVDEIEYKFGYTPETNWCSDNAAPPEMKGEYKYEFGSNSCSGSTSTCSDGREMDFSYNQCSTFWGTSRPTYTLSLKK